MEKVRENLRTALLAWYDRAGRDLPWRVRAGRAEPYRVWLSEIMLQQTTVATVGPYFAKFLARWPSVEALAAASRDDVLEAWAGLGYYSRARNLHAAAQALAARGFPQTEAELRALPGIGPYTAAAIAAIAFGQPANAVDGNVERVMARLYAVEAPLPASKPTLHALAASFVAKERASDWPQALMDLGATVCTPRSPKCGACPLQSWCAAFATGEPEGYPRRAAKAVRPERYGAAFRIARDGAVWLVRRPDAGLLGGMAGLPTTPWRDKKWSKREALTHAPAHAAWKRSHAVRHVFTHFALTLDIYSADTEPAGDGYWGDGAALPTVFKKALAAD